MVAGFTVVNGDRMDSYNLLGYTVVYGDRSIITCHGSENISKIKCITFDRINKYLLLIRIFKNYKN